MEAKICDGKSMLEASFADKAFHDPSSSRHVLGGGGFEQKGSPTISFNKVLNESASGPCDRGDREEQQPSKQCWRTFLQRFYFLSTICFVLAFTPFFFYILHKNMISFPHLSPTTTSSSSSTQYCHWCCFSYTCCYSCLCKAFRYSTTFLFSKYGKSTPPPAPPCPPPPR